MQTVGGNRWIGGDCYFDRMQPANETALDRCIRLRQRVRRALDENDMETVVWFNRLADDAYLMMTPLEQSAYCAWAFGETN